MNSKEAINELNSLLVHNILYGGNSLSTTYYISKWSAERIVQLIQQQDKMIELACQTTARHCCYPSQDCPAPLPLPCADCWRKFLQGEVEK